MEFLKQLTIAMFAIATLGFTQSSFAEALLFEGDFNGDGLQDILVGINPSYVEPALADIPSVALTYSSQIVLQRRADGLFDKIFIDPNSSSQQNQINSMVWRDSGRQIFSADFDRNGVEDLFVQAENGSEASVVIYNTVDINPIISTHSEQNALRAQINVGGQTIFLSRDRSTLWIVPGTNFIQASDGFNTFTITAKQDGRFDLGDPSLVALTAKNYYGGDVNDARSPYSAIVPGATPSSLDVNESGNATYSIPISLPVGSAGVQPGLSVSYASGGQDGILGQGWGLVGLSAIHRCAKTKVDDGQDGSISFSTDDRFCLDGQRLIVVTSSASQTEYRTSDESFSQIISYGVSTNPDRFEVRNKSGETVFFGETPDSKVSSNGKGVIWSVNRLQDRFNNIVSYNYTKVGEEQQYIDKINYANVEVRFTYLDRSSARLKDIISYSGGGKSVIAKRLSELQVYVNGAQAHSYWFSYKRSPIADMLQLKAVTECAVRSSSAVKDCFRPLEFTYNDGGQPSIVQKGSAGQQQFPTATGYYQRLSLDFDADGFQDQLLIKRGANSSSFFNYALYRNNHNGQLVLSGGEGGEGAIGSLGWVAPGSENSPYFFVIDFDQDGREELAYIAKNGDGMAYFDAYSFLGNGGSIQRKFAQSPSVGAWTNRNAFNPANFFVFDTNGDRRPDVVRIDATSQTKANLTVWTMNPGGTYSQLPAVDMGLGIYPTLPSVGEPKYRSTFLNFDYDGDSYQDFVILTPEMNQVSLSQEQKLNLCGLAGDTVWKVTTNAKVFQSQINGSFLKIKDSIVSERYVCEPLSDSSAAQLSNITFLKENAIKDQQFIPGDYNGDGVTDLIEVYKQNKSKYYQLLVGSPQQNRPFTSITGDVQLRNTDDKKDPDILMPADINGDERADIILLRKVDSSAVLIPMISNGSGFDGLLPMVVGPYQNSTVSCDGGYIPMDINADGLVELMGGVATVSGSTCTLNNNVIGLQGAAAYSPLGSLKRVQNGMGLVYEVDYKPLTDPSVYTKDTTAVPNGLNVVLPQPVVSEARSSNGLGGFTRTQYEYFGLKTNLTGYGNLGFRKVTEYELDPVPPYSREKKTETLYSQDVTTDTVGKVERVTSGRAEWDLASKFYSRTTNTWKTIYLTVGASKTRFTYLDNENKVSKDIDGLTDLSVSTTTNQYLADGVTGNSFPWDSAVGNVKKITSTITSGSRLPTGSSLQEKYTTVTTSTYKPDDLSNWILGRIERTVVTKSGRNHNGVTVPTIVRTSSWEYNPNGTVSKEIVEPDSATLRQETQYEYNGRGIRYKLTESGSRITTPRTTTTDFDPLGLYATSVTNAKSQTESTEYDAYLGLPTKKTVPISATSYLVTSTTYDAFGRVATVTSPDGITATSRVEFCGSNCPTGAVYYIATVTNAGGASETYFDSLGRVLRSGSKGFDGEMIYVSTVYDAKGRQVETSDPWKASQAPSSINWTKVTNHDEWDRPTEITDPRLLITTTVYTPDCKTVTNENGKNAKACTNLLGLPSRTEDHDGKLLVFAYDAYDHLILTEDRSTSPATRTAAAYDLRGNKTAMFDPDLNRIGSVSVNILTGVVSITNGNMFYYDGFGQLTGTQDAKGQKTCLAYDELGRMVKRVDGYVGNLDSDSWRNCANDTDNVTSPTRTSRWEYDTASNGLGKIAVITGPEGYKEEYAYDAKGRPSSITKTVRDNAGSLQSFTTSTTYDDYSRPLIITYPGQFKVKQSYNAAGAMYLLEDVSLSGTKPLWHALSSNERGQITNERLGHGVVTTKAYDSKTGWLTDASAWNPSTMTNDILNIHTEWDKVGNLTLRQDRNLETYERVGYDNLNRIAVVTFGYTQSGATTPTETSQVNRYLPNGNIDKKFGVGKYAYGTKPSYCSAVTGAVTPGPHAVSTIVADTDPNSTNEAVKPASYCYDANGNMLAASTGRVVKWTSYDMPSEISNGTTNTKFWYGPDRARYKRVDVKDGVTTATLYSDSYEKITYSNATPMEQRYYIGGVAVVSVKNNDLAARLTNYQHTDHLGSVVAVSTLENNTVVVKERASFDPWGKRRDIAQKATWGANASATTWWYNYKSQFTSRGFTGHEQIDSLGLIHMNGRVYDPEIGRFLSADPIVQAPGNIQSYNRYSYVMNNPLTLTDPSGFSWLSKTWKKVKNFAKRALRAIKRIHEATIDALMVPWRETKRLFMRIPALQQIATIAVCAATSAATLGMGCAAFQGLMTWGMTGDFGAGITAFAWGAVTVAVWGGMHTFGESQFGTAIRGFGRSIAHGVVGGALAKLQGGDFRSAFWSNAIGKGVFESGLGYQGKDVFAHAAEAALVGGTASALSGGSFANGAKSAAMARLFNDVAQYVPNPRMIGAAFFNQAMNDIGQIGNSIADVWSSIAPDSVELNVANVQGLGFQYGAEYDGDCLQFSVAGCSGIDKRITVGANWKLYGPELDSGIYQITKSSQGIVPRFGVAVAGTQYFDFKNKNTSGELKAGIATGVGLGRSYCEGLMFNYCSGH